MKFKVAGFLSDASFFYDNSKNDMTSCGRYLIMPAFENLSNDYVGIMAADQYKQSYIYTHGQYQIVCDDVENII